MYVFTREDGLVANTQQLAGVPKGVSYIEVDKLPSKLLREAWYISWGNKSQKNGTIKVNLSKGKVVAHTLRRRARRLAMKPHDSIIALQLPNNEAVEAEEHRAAIRVVDAGWQKLINACTTEKKLLSFCKEAGLV